MLPLSGSLRCQLPHRAHSHRLAERVQVLQAHCSARRRTRGTEGCCVCEGCKGWPAGRQ